MRRRAQASSTTASKTSAREARKETARFVPYGSAAPMAGPDLKTPRKAPTRGKHR